MEDHGALACAMKRLLQREDCRLGKITLIGAGSATFSKRIMGDCMLIPALKGYELAIHDIHEGRLRGTEMVLNAVKDTVGSDVTIRAYSDRREALRGAKYVINTILVGGIEHVTLDIEIPKKYGLRQTIADTIGIGGLFRVLRTLPVMLEFAEDMHELCPEAIMLNYTNPMSALTMGMDQLGHVQIVGLCHSVQTVARDLLRPLDMDWQGVQVHVAGINHMAWVLAISKDGVDLYPEIKRRSKARCQEGGAKEGLDLVRHEIMHRVGFYVTESSTHHAEYYPYFIKRDYPELVERFDIPLDKGLANLRRKSAAREREKNELMKSGQLAHKRSVEYGSSIIEAIETDKALKFAGNVMNNGLITNLPREACVEVPCLADGSGIAPTVVGDLPPVLAALNRTQINTQILAVEAVRTRRKEDVYHAAMLDPHTAAELSIDDIVALCDELMEAHGDLLPNFS